MSLQDLGLDAGRLIAGFCGGVVHAFAFKQTTPMAQLSSVVVGTLMANFLGPAAGHYIGTWLGDGGSAFVVGLSGMVMCQGIVAAVRSRTRTALAPPSQTGEP